MKIRVKVVCTFLTLSKKSPLFPNPGYAPGYGIIIWGSRYKYKSHLEKLSSLHNKAIRAVGGAEWNESSSPLYYKFKVLKFHDIYKYELAKFMHHVQHNTLPTSLMNFFDYVKNDLNFNTRSRTREKLKVPLFKSSRTQKSVKFEDVTLWNSLSLNFKKLPFRKFSSQYKSQRWSPRRRPWPRGHILKSLA